MIDIKKYTLDTKEKQALKDLSIVYNRKFFTKKQIDKIILPEKKKKKLEEIKTKSFINLLKKK